MVVMILPSYVSFGHDKCPFQIICLTDKLKLDTSKKLCYNDTIKRKEVLTMTTKCYFLDNSNAAARAVDYLANLIPCFIRGLFVAKDGSLTVTIEARNEDLATVERILAPYV